MATVSVLNTTSNVSGKTLVLAEQASTITGLHTFDRDPNAPFAVTGGSAVVPNLDADKVDGYEASGLARLDSANTFSSATPIILSHASGGVGERNRAFQMGEWQSVTFAAGNFTGNGSMTWTVASGDQTTFQYTLVGKMMTVVVKLANTTVGGTPNDTLQIAIPGGFTAAADCTTLGHGDVNGIEKTCHVYTLASANTLIHIAIVPNANWTASTDNTDLAFSFTFPVS